MSDLERIQTENALQAIGPYSQAVRAGGFVFVSGQIPLDPATGTLAAESIEDQTERVLTGLRAILEAAGTSMGRVVKTTVYLVDLSEFPRMNETYARMFGDARPARATVEVSALPKGVRIEIDAIAMA